MICALTLFPVSGKVQLGRDESVEADRVQSLPGLGDLGDQVLYTG